MPSDRRRTDRNYRRGRSGRPYERAKARCFATESVCWRCGGPVDMTLPYRDPITGEVNVWSKSFDHTVELDAGGAPYQGRLAHLKHNTSAGARYGNKKRERQKKESRTSKEPRRWSFGK